MHLRAKRKWKIDSIAERLAGGYHAHGHPISPKAAADLGLTIEVAKGDTAKALWAMVEDADVELDRHKPVDPQGWILTEWERRLKEWTTALQTPTPPATALSAKEMIQAELNAAQLNAQMPIRLTVDVTMGLIESAQGAAAYEATLRYIGMVGAAGLQITSCPPVGVWKSVD